MSEIESFLGPISEDEPTGSDLREDIEDETFTRLDELTTSVDVASAGSEEDVVEPNWSGVVGLCHSALHEKTKDLQLITSLSEAWLRTEGIHTAEWGIELLRENLERFWPRIHPGYDADEDEISLGIRLRWLNWMDAATGYIRALKQSAMLPRPEGGSYSWGDHENSALLDDATLAPERRQELVETGIIDDAQWQTAIGGMDRTALRELMDSFSRCIEQCKAMRAFCAEPFAADEDYEAPDFYNLIGLFEEMRDYLAEITGEGDEVGSEGADVGALASAAAGSTIGGGGPMQTRPDALRQLQEVGDYFRRTEPHSPISYLIARAVKWGTMPLDLLLKDVVRDEAVIEHIWETLGLDADGVEEND